MILFIMKSFLMKKNISDNTTKFISGLAAGVMLAASIWSLIIPAIDLSNGNPIPTLIGFIIGMLFLLIVDKKLERKNKIEVLLERYKFLSNLWSLEAIFAFSVLNVITASPTSNPFTTPYLSRILGVEKTGVFSYFHLVYIVAKAV